jgi:hypothetical protein
MSTKTFVGSTQQTVLVCASVVGNLVTAQPSVMICRKKSRRRFWVMLVSGQQQGMFSTPRILLSPHSLLILIYCLVPFKLTQSSPFLSLRSTLLTLPMLFLALTHTHALIPLHLMVAADALLHLLLTTALSGQPHG